MPTHILATAGYDHTIRLWEVTSGFCHRTLQFQESQVNRLSITPNKQYIAAAGNPQIRLFELMTNNPQPVNTFVGHKGNVMSIGFPKDPSGRWMYSGSEDGTVKLWDIRNSGSSRDIEYSEACTSVVLHPNQKHLVCSYQNGEIRIYDHQTLSKVSSFFPSSDTECSIQSLDVDSTGKYCAAVNNKGMCIVMSLSGDDLSQIQVTKQWKAHDKYALKTLFSPNSKLLVTTSSDHTAKLWSVSDNFKHEKTLVGHQRWVWDCAFSSNSTYCITVSSDHVARLWDLSQGETVRHYTGHRKTISCVALHDSDADNNSNNVSPPLTTSSGSSTASSSS
eukprot:TRINITY_DN1777_c0_g1_i1.p1 TRINITY_DN1777_c0_g1~~TRINITY_DN1777_c0_g1_i1.p1  ORF type:complete len:334 (-),score=56.14 TRINITY_DN1777_c0_g1_i1:54-1055(-)